MVSQRLSNAEVSSCLLFEFEDALGSLEGAELLAPGTRSPRSPRFRAMAGQLKDLSSRVASRSWGKRASAPRKYEVVFVNVLSLAGLAALEPVVGLRRLGQVSVCNVTEVWAKGLKQRTGEIRALRGFDLIAVGCAGSVEEVARLTGRPCIYLPPSVDALEMCPIPDGPDRRIDVYAMGRRPAHTHAALLRQAARRGWYYMYDTVAGRVGFTNHREHRTQLADRIRRSRYFLTNVGKANAEDETGGQQEVGQRFFEGAAGGSVLFGMPPRTIHFREQFGWPDSVVEMPYDSEEVDGCLDPLESDPARVDRIRRRNVVESLRRHDHVYRWSRVLEAIRLPETTAMRTRKAALTERALGISDGTTGSSPRPAGAGAFE